MSDRADDALNNLIAAGGIYGALLAAAATGLDLSAEVEMDNGEATNKIKVRMSFLRSAYRVTVERIDDEDQRLMQPASAG